VADKVGFNLPTAEIAHLPRTQVPGEFAEYNKGMSLRSQRTLR